MKREIKFRAWDKDKKFMKYYDFLYTAQAKRFGQDNWDLEHLMQYTGLKDKNGKECFEGDIIKSLNDQFIVNDFITDIYRLKVWRDSKDIDWEIIGNIYQNPELIK